MSFIEFLADVISSLAWPAVVVAALLVFRRPIRDLIGRVRSAKGYGVAVDFERVADDAKGVAKAVIEDLKHQSGGKSAAAESQPVPEAEPVHVPANEDPTFAVISSWERVDAALRDLAGASAGRQVRARTVSRPTVEIARELQVEGVVNDRFVDSVMQLRRLRNAAAHGQSVSYGEAESYVAAANELIRATGAIIDFRFAGGAD